MADIFPLSRPSVSNTVTNQNDYVCIKLIADDWRLLFPVPYVLCTIELQLVFDKSVLCYFITHLLTNRCCLMSDDVCSHDVWLTFCLNFSSLCYFCCCDVYFCYFSPKWLSLKQCLICQVRHYTVLLKHVTVVLISLLWATELQVAWPVQCQTYGYLCQLQNITAHLDGRFVWTSVVGVICATQPTVLSLILSEAEPQRHLSITFWNATSGHWLLRTPWALLSLQEMNLKRCTLLKFVQIM